MSDINAVRYVVEIVSNDADHQTLIEHRLLTLASEGIWVSAISVTDPATGAPDNIEAKFPLNVALVTAYAKARKAGGE
jgi:hypothetical protein